MNESIVISGLSQIDNYLPGDSSSFSTLDFETKESLGKKGTRNMDRLTALVIGGMEGLMPQIDVDRNTLKEDIGIVVGSSQGSMDSIVRFTYETLAYDRPDFVNPALFPNTVMNCAAGQAAIWYKLGGLNATISCYEMSFLMALDYSQLQLFHGAAKSLIVGSAEELTEVSKVAQGLISNSRNEDSKFSECSMFMLLETEEESRKNNRPVMAKIRSISVGFNPSVDSSVPLENLIQKALGDAGIEPGAITASVISGNWSRTEKIELQALNNILGKDHKILNAYKEYGNGGSAHNLFQFRTLYDELSTGQLGLLIMQEYSGNMAALIIEKGGYDA